MPEEHRENFFIELLKFALVAVVIVVPIRLWVAQPFIVSGASMEPTFATGEYLIVDELSYHFGDPQRGDIVIFRYPRNPSEFYIKRIIGLPGERLEIGGSGVTVYDREGRAETLDESYLVDRGNGASLSVTLGADQYFVLGDNRPNSSDSRYWGPLPRNDIVGRAFLRLFPLSTAAVLPGDHSFAPLTAPAPGGATYGTSFNFFARLARAK